MQISVAMVHSLRSAKPSKSDEATLGKALSISDSERITCIDTVETPWNIFLHCHSIYPLLDVL